MSTKNEVKEERTRNEQQINVSAVTQPMPSIWYT